MPTPTSGVLYVSGGFGIVEFPGGVATLRDGCDYDDGDVIISGGIVRAFDPATLGVSDHDDLGNLGWAACGHTGTANRVAIFDGSGVAAEVAQLSLAMGGTGASLTDPNADRILFWDDSAGTVTWLTVGSNLSISGTTLLCTLSTLDHAALSNLPWASSGHTSTSWNIPYFGASGEALVDNDFRYGDTSKTLTVNKIAVTDVTLYGDFVFFNETASRVLVTDASKIVQTSSVTTTELGYLSGVTSLIQTQLNNLSLRVCGRLTLESGVPFSINSQTAKTTVYWTPYNGNSIPIYDSTLGGFVSRSDTEKSVAVPSTLFRGYDIFAYWTGSALALETTNWDQTTASISAFNAGTQTFTTSASHGLSAGDRVGIAGITGTCGTDSTYGANGRVWTVGTAPTTTTFTLDGSNLGSLAYTSGGTMYRIPNTRATALAVTNGIYTKNGDSTRTYLGSGMTTGVSGQTEMSFYGECRLLLWNQYNQLPTFADSYEGSSHSYTTGAWRLWNAKPSNRIVFFSGQSTAIEAILGADSWGGAGYVAYSIDAISGMTPTIRNQNASIVSAATVKQIAAGAGCHILSSVQYGAAGFNVSFSDLYASLLM